MSAGVLSHLVRVAKRPFKALEERFFPERLFTRIYERKRWSSGGTPSGAGSTLERTSELRERLPALFRRYEIRSILDIPCGDFNWMAQLEYPFDLYIGGDIVRSLVEDLQSRHAASNRRFEHLDVIEDRLPAVDLVFCRDCWVHLSNAQVARAIENVRRSGAKYLLATTYPEHRMNVDVRTGNWRPINLQLPPFGLPQPIELLREAASKAPNAPWADKSLGLWSLADKGAGARLEAQPR